MTENQRFGATRNPWRTTLSAGGSSGGSAAAVAAGMVGLADGSDLGGSLRIPAACCGVIALKPSRGRVSIGPDYGDVAGGVPTDGPIARTTLDAAVALDVMSGYEPGDHHWIGPAARSFATAAANPAGRVTVRVATAPRWACRSTSSRWPPRSARLPRLPSSVTTWTRAHPTGTTRRSRAPGPRSRPVRCSTSSA